MRKKGATSPPLRLCRCCAECLSRNSGLPVASLELALYRFGFGGGDVVDDAFRPAVDVHPAIAVADAVFVRRHVSKALSRHLVERYKA